MPAESVVDRLAALPIFESVPRPELEWLVTHGELRSLPAGTVMNETSAPVDEMSIVLVGRMAMYQQKSGASRKLMEAGVGRVLGTLPYSRFQRVPGTAIVEEDITAFVVNRRHFPAMMHEAMGLTTALVHHMLDRARDFRSVQLNDDRLQSLSRLASGFAHELNNPASAAARTAQSLVGLLDEEDRAARELASARLNDDQLAVVDAVRHECGQPAQARTALEAADREDDIAEWLTRHGIEASVAEALAASDVTMDALEHLASALPSGAVAIATQWIATGCAARAASRQIEAATGKIHHLVGVMKGFTFMDREARAGGGRRRARPGGHARDAGWQGAGEIRGGASRNGARPSAGTGFRQRDQSGMGEARRQCPRCHRASGHRHGHRDRPRRCHPGSRGRRRPRDS